MFGKVLTAMVTPFRKDMSIDYGGAEKLAVYLADNGSDGLVIHGTTGESPTLTHEEEYELYGVVKKAVGKKVKVVAGTGSNSTATTIKSTKKAEEVGVDGAMIVLPYYNKPSQEGLYQHFKAVADNTSLPLIIYNIPGRCAINMNPDTVARLSKIKNYVGIKEASGNLDQVSAIRAVTSKDFKIWSGDDSLTLPILSVGGEGVISVASHLVGKEISKMVNSFHSGDVQGALKIHIKLLPIFKVLFITTNPVPVKAALELSGIKVGGTRLPLASISSEERAKIKKVLEEFGLIKKA
jgi:4-hydroxy-tetrahydrodipicolinate synthase